MTVSGDFDVARELRLAPDPELARAADALAAGVVRFHPSFRFEERVAARIRAARYAGMADGTGGRRLLTFPAVQLPLALDLAGPAAMAGAMNRVPRPVLVGGAIASGVSLAGAVVAWRRLRRTV